MKLYESLVKNIGIGKDAYVKEWLQKHSNYNSGIKIQDGVIVGNRFASQLWLDTTDIPTDIKIERVRDLGFVCDIDKSPVLPSCHVVRIAGTVAKGVDIALEDYDKESFDDFATGVVFKMGSMFKDIKITFKSKKNRIQFNTGEVDEIASVKTNCVEAFVSSDIIDDKYEDILYDKTDKVIDLVNQCFPARNYPKLNNVDFHGYTFKKNRNNIWEKV